MTETRMVAVPSPDNSVEGILSILESSTSSTDDKIDAYTSFCSHFQDDELSLFSLDIGKNIQRLYSVVQRDISTDAPSLCQGALQTLGLCLNDTDVVRNLSPGESMSVISDVCQCVLKTEDKTTCTRALWCVSRQKMSQDIVQKQLHSILCAIDHAQSKWRGQSVTVEHEVVNVIDKLVEQVPKQMSSHGARWGKILIPYIVHSAIKVRERALQVMEASQSILMVQQKEVVSSLPTDVKSKLCGELKKLMTSQHEIFAIKCWGLLVQMFGEELHRGSFINNLLSVVEIGFKATSTDVKIASFHAWQQLIDNFATNSSILSDPKRVKLIMQVFKINNAKVEAVAMVKLKVWWHFAWLLGSKLSSNFEQVAVPLLNFCTGGARPGSHSGAATPRQLANGPSPVTPRLNLSTSSSQLPVFTSLQLEGCEVLAHFLGAMPPDVDIPHYEFALDALRQDVISGPAFFLKQAPLLISTATELIKNLGKDTPDGLLFHIWYSLVAHLKNALDSSSKSDVREALTTFLTQFQVLLLCRVLQTSTVLKMFQAVCCLPTKALCSTAYNIGSGEMVNGTPALFLIELLLTPMLLQGCNGSESYHSLFSTLISAGMSNSFGTLEFLSSVLQLLDRNAEFVDHPEMLWRLWSSVSQPLLDHITKTNEVNQGDVLEPNFSCLYQALILPIAHLLPAKMPQPSVKTLQKSWSDLYRTFSRLAAMVTNAEANVTCESLCQKILDCEKASEKTEPALVEFLTHICQVVLNSVDFSSVGAQPTFNLNASSPAKWTKRKQKPMENLQSFVMLIQHLLKQALVIASDPDSGSKQKSGNFSLQAILNTLVDLFSMLFTHVSSSSIICNMIGQLAQPISELYQVAAKKGTNKVYNNSFDQKLEKLWLDVCTSIQSKYTGGFDSIFLKQLSPLLEVTFLHSRRQIKNQTMLLWNATFSKAASLIYPDALRPVLTKVREKSPISLPGWIVMDIQEVIAETPISQMSQAGSQAPEPHIPGMPSPHKIHGSFLNKAVSPNIKKSPARAIGQPLRAESAKKKLLSFGDFSNQDYVVIKASPRKKQPLTEHQKEVMKERRSLPAMYNSLEVSQDVSMMASQFGSDTQMSETPTPTTTSDSFVLFGKAVPAFPAKNKKPKQADEPHEAESVSTTGRKKAKLCESEDKVISPESSSNRGRPTRRKSVRFKDSTSSEKNDETNSKSGTSSEKDNSSASNVEESSDIKQTKCEKNSKQDEKSSSPEGSSGQEKSSEMDMNDSVIVIGSQKSQLSSSSSSVVCLDSEKEKSGSVWSGLEPSVPQNLLGAIVTDTEYSSSKSGNSSSGDIMKSQKNLSEETGDGGLTHLKEKPLSTEPLLSWSKKLDELSQSSQSRSMSPMRRSLSSSPIRSQSPSKSPRRTRLRKKEKESNENEGNLDRWIIRSPLKNPSDVIKPLMEKEKSVSSSAEIIGVTIVEETQSPTKFSKKSLDEDGKMPTIEETPPKNVPSALGDENSVNSLGNSNRKLFQATENHPLVDIVEDSNIIPGSPDAKSFGNTKTGTPTCILKLKKLTDDEIKRYSPVREKEAKLDATPTKSVEVDREVENKTCVEKRKILKHEHDDFSEIKPLDDEVDEILHSDSFLCGNSDAKLKTGVSIENTETDMFDSEKTGIEDTKVGLEGNFSEGGVAVVDTDNDVEMKSPSQSQNLFSQVDSHSKLEGSQEFNPLLQGTLRDSGEILPKKVDSEMLSSQESTESESASQRQTEESDVEAGSYDPTKNSTLVSQGTPTTRRKRKQLTPKKLSPEDWITAKRSRSSKKAGKSMGKETNRSVKKAKTDKDSQERSTRKTSKTGHKDSKFDSQEFKSDSQSSRSDSQDSKSDSQDSRTDNREMKGRTPRGRKAKKDTSTDLEMKTAIEITGEKTPESRNISKPERKSTTKQKKDIALRRTQLRGKEFIINDENSNLDRDSSDDDVPISKVVKKLTEEQDGKDLPVDVPVYDKDDKGIEEEKMEVVDESKSNVDKSAEKDVADSHTSSDDDIPLGKLVTKAESDDDVPLGKLMDKINSKEVMDEDNVPLSSLTSDSRKPKKNVRKPGKKMAGKGDSQSKDEHKSLEKENNQDKEKNVEKEKSIQAKDKKEKDGTSSQSTRGKRMKSGIASSQSGKLKSPRTSPMSQRLRSGERILRNKGKVIRRSLSLTRRTGRRSNEGEMEKLGTKSGLRVNKDKKQQENSQELLGKSSVEKISKESAENVASEEKNLKVNKEVESKADSEIVAKVTDSMDASKLSKNKGSIKPSEEESNVEMKETCEKELEETPRKATDGIKSSGVTLFYRNSDSKLVLGSRQFGKRKALARRSILKHTSHASEESDVSPLKEREFHPIQVARIYSPTASPSASILKKRRLSADSATDTSSPPAKQRRVSFAEPLTCSQEETENAQLDVVKSEAARPPSPLVTSSISQVTSSADKFFTFNSTSQEPCSLTPSSSSKKDSQLTQTQTTYRGTQESQLNPTDAICPDLVQCKEAVEKVLPQLTSSVWSRGLGQLVRARNIHTIGDLSALTEMEVHHLPIRSPKVPTVRKVLHNYVQQEAKKFKTPFSKGVETQKGVAKEEMGKSLDTVAAWDVSVNKEQAGDKLQPTADDLASSVEALLADSGDLLDEVNRLSQDYQDQQNNQSESGKAPPDLPNQSKEDLDSNIESDNRTINTASDKNLLSTLSTLQSQFTVEDIKQLKTEELFQVHQHISDLQNRVVSALRVKCHSPTAQ